MWTIAKRFEISSAHFLPNVGKNHPCSSVHGHNYTIEIVLQSDQLDSSGFVVDYQELGHFKALLSRLDHNFLNEIPGLENPTAELIARFLYYEAVQNWHQVIRVRVSETPGTWAEYEMIK